jgi:nitroreductase
LVFLPDIERKTLLETSLKDIHEILRKRRSGRAYDASRAVSKSDIDALLEAARWAPSGNNIQPWRFVIGVKGTPVYDALFELLMGFNRDWAQHAPVLILTAYQTHRVNDKGERVANNTAEHDAGSANMSIAIEAVNRGLMTHMMGGFNRAAARIVIDAEQNDLAPVTMTSVGYALDPGAVPEALRERESAPRQRKPVDELLITLSV